MKRSYARAIGTFGCLALAGLLLVHLALRPPKPKPVAPVSSLSAASCAATLDAWNAIEGLLTGGTAAAADIGARCRLFTCPELDCEALQSLRGAVSLLDAALGQLVATPIGLAQPGEPQGCTAVVGPLAERLVPGLRAARRALDVCGARGLCSALRLGGRTGDDVASPPAQIRAQVARIKSEVAALRLSESPAAEIRLDLAQYVTGDAMEVAVEPGRNRCLAKGGALGIYADDGMRRLTGTPLHRAPLDATGHARLLLEAPAAPGRYLVAVQGETESERALGVAPFLVEAPAPGCTGFSGRWETDRGVLSASVRRGVLRGTYKRAGAQAPGFLTGLVKGRHFHGSWSSELGAGGVHLVLAKGGERFLGTTGDEPGAEDGAGLWRGHCVSGDKRVRNE